MRVRMASDFSKAGSDIDGFKESFRAGVAEAGGISEDRVVVSHLECHLIKYSHTYTYQTTVVAQPASKVRSITKGSIIVAQLRHLRSVVNDRTLYQVCS